MWPMIYQIIYRKEVIKMVKALNMSEVELIRKYYQSLPHKDDNNGTSTISIPEEKIVEVPVILGY